jgi:1-acyl-sn-glycerol-3-phosphate acyltransferase
METTQQTRSSTAVPAAPADGAPRPTLGGRLHYAWFCVVALLGTIPMSIIQLVTHTFDPTARNFKRNATVWGRVILRGAGIRVRAVTRVPLDPARPYVFVSNHQNLLDILALGDALPYPFGFVAKQELRRVPFLGFAIGHSASVFIDRSDPRRSIQSLQEAGERIRAGNSVLVFAEGTRSYAAALQPLKKGAFNVAIEAGVPLVPVTILDAYRLMNEKEKAVRSGTIHLVVGAPIAMEGRHRRDIPEVMDLVQAQMEAELAGRA